MKNILEELSLVSAPWSFAQWGVNIVGPLVTEKRGCKFLVMEVDYFTKWTVTNHFFFYFFLQKWNHYSGMAICH
jgi:hypothetical protein